MALREQEATRKRLKRQQESLKADSAAKISKTKQAQIEGLKLHMSFGNCPHDVTKPCHDDTLMEATNEIDNSYAATIEP